MVMMTTNSMRASRETMRVELLNGFVVRDKTTGKGIKHPAGAIIDYPRGINLGAMIKYGLINPDPDNPRFQRPPPKKRGPGRPRKETVEAPPPAPEHDMESASA